MAFDAGAIVANLKLDTRGFQAGIKQATTKMKSAEKTASSLSKVIGSTLAIGAVGSLVLGFKRATDAAGDFEESMANVSTLIDTTKINVQDLSNSVLEMTTDVLKSSDDLSAGLYQVFSAGVTEASEALDVLRVSAIAATAGVSTTAISVKAITSILNAFGLEAAQATDISDLLFQTVKLGVTTYSELAGALGTVISTAASLGIKLEDLFAAIATLTKGGLETRVATTALRATFISILKPSEEALKTAKALGLEWSAAAVRAKGLIAFVNEMKEATDGNTEEMAKLIPEATALTAVLALTGEQSEELNKILGEMQNRLGSTQEAFRKQERAYNNQVKAIGLLIDRIQIKIGGVFIPEIQRVLTNINKLFDDVGKAYDILAKRLSKPIIIPSPSVIDTGGFFDFLKQGTIKFEFFAKVINTTLKKVLRGVETDSKKIAKSIEETTKKSLTTVVTESKKAAGELNKAWTATSEQVKDAFTILGVLPKEQIAGQIQELSDAFNTITSEMDVNQQDVIRLREGLFKRLQEISAQTDDELIALGFKPEELREEINKLHEQLLRGTEQTTTKIQEEGNTIIVHARTQIKATEDIVTNTLNGLEELIGQTANRQIGVFGLLTDELTTYKNAYITAEEEITKVIEVESGERLSIIQRFVDGVLQKFSLIPIAPFGGAQSGAGGVLSGGSAFGGPSEFGGDTNAFTQNNTFNVPGDGNIGSVETQTNLVSAVNQASQLNASNSY